MLTHSAHSEMVNGLARATYHGQPLLLRDTTLHLHLSFIPIVTMLGTLGSSSPVQQPSASAPVSSPEPAQQPDHLTSSSSRIDIDGARSVSVSGEEGEGGAAPSSGMKGGEQPEGPAIR
jgi:hypothetical protein